MKEIKEGDKVRINTGLANHRAYLITDKMRTLEGKILTVWLIDERLSGLLVYKFRETGAGVGWLREWFTPITELTLYDLIDKSDTL